MVSPEDSAHPTSHSDSQPQTNASQAASPQSTVSLPIPAGPVGTISANTPAAGASDAQANGSAADQLSRAFVAQASLVNHDGRTDFHLRLQPPQLGSVQIHLTATDHTVSARVIVTQDGARQLIEGQVQQLRQSLADSGLVLGSFDVMQNSGGFSQGGHHPQPELPPPPTNLRSKPAAVTPTAVVKTSPVVPRGGINILA